ncbi:ergothioneine biosynthesis protein EgtB [Aquabacterium sp. OR-4]|uniref:ergothioneine biosynthesis protein EgtB n=1 Tax=Aquabacterium sp. OR-4 TaxID=2978127 RepID=UPI0028C8B6E6|nr:ergothioneine biosynthesis protein EgtB [Aquabacterium sp. OR-4]MDT7838573.1 ergothioneine biosynthesis protein EgtB [Aquabacterium sp. OR-4]
MSTLCADFLAVRRGTEALTAGLTAEDCQLQSMPDASPVKWHLAHTSWFFEQFIAVPRGIAPVNPAYAALFNSYYVGAGPRHPRLRRGDLSRPALVEVMDYRRQVTQAVAGLLGDRQHAADTDLHALVTLGIAHEQQHQELIVTDMKHHFACQPLSPLHSPAPAQARGVAPILRYVPMAGGLVAIGHEGPDFAFDNEMPRHRVWLEPYALADRLVTETEYLAFMDDGGYAQPTLWLSDGWAAREAQGWAAPLHWQHDGDGWRVLTWQGWRRPRADVAVCHVSHYEADAYARWADARLPTAPEWEAASAQPGADEPARHGAWLEDGHRHPAPMAALPAGSGLRQMFGDCWQWTGSSYLPYPGYRVPAGTVGEYNGKFMSGQMVLKGGSAATPRGHARPSYRNFFPPGARWQFSGIRLARDGGTA